MTHTCGSANGAHGRGNQREEGVEFVGLIAAACHPPKVHCVPDGEARDPI